ncbi:GAF domain-containing protein [Nakamurella flava]|uniref:GAF domain-containing protein n=1 Tax=Nakamurella flava TaxID=2576308 RepID=A0A4U6QL43_9ACTN|nr:GAF domain-containing protein [Nakamurella flava]TKV61203.1 GAF domain-containing protein [Nakamurella flava]
MVRKCDGRPGDSDPGLRIGSPLRELIDQAEEVLLVRDRLRKLIDASRLVMAQLELPDVLQRVTTAAADLTGATYAALGVLSPEGGLEQFLHTGMAPDAVAGIDHLPRGLGLLGAVISEAEAIRLDDLAGDPRSSGLPVGHPPMRSFLGVPIRLRDAVYGNLYLADPRVAAFTTEDTEVIQALAATAATAIENARLFDAAHLRQRWLQSSNQLMIDVLTGSADTQHVVDIARETADADIGLHASPVPDSDLAVIDVVSGPSVDGLTGATFPLMGTRTREVLNNGRSLRTRIGGRNETPPPLRLDDLDEVGPLIMVPLTGGHGTRGVLVLGRRVDRPDFTAAELDLVATYAGHAAVALELVEARAAQARIDILEDRERIARDLHDHVIQRLFAVGLRLQGGQRAAPPQLADRIGQAVDDLDDTITQIRTTIFELNRRPTAGSGSLRAIVLRVVDELSPGLRRRPTVELRGPLDSLVPRSLYADVEAVLREGLANVARHAHADDVEVGVDVADGVLVLEVIDDGPGFGDDQSRSGLDNLRRRAERHHGTLWLSPPGQPGAVLRWSVPLPASRSAPS